MSLAYDPTGKNPENMKRETKRLSDAPNKWRVIVPTYAPFYRSDLVILDDDGNELFEGVDFYLGHYYSELSASLKRPIYGSIILKGDSLDEVSFSRYRAVGGDHMAAPTDVANYIADPESPDPRSTDWAVIRVRKIDISTNPPPANMTEARASDPVTESLWQLKEAMVANQTGSKQQLVDLTTQLTDLTALIVNSAYETHLDDTGQYAHKLSCEVIGAAKKSDTAPDVQYFHELPYETFKDRASQYAMQPIVLSTLLNRLNDEMKGVLRFTGDYQLEVSGGVRFKTRGEELLIDTVKPTLEVEIVGDSVKSLLFTSGVGNFTLKSTDGVVFVNNKPIVTTDEVKEYLNPSLGKADRVHYINNEDVSFAGIGTSAAKLSATAKIKLATGKQTGLFYVSDNFLADKAATSDYLFKTLQKINLLADKDFSVNGVQFSENMSFTKDDLGLEKVNNTNAANKPISNKLRKALDTKRDVDHDHNYGNINNPKRGTTKEAGLAQYDASISGATNKLVKRNQLQTQKNALDQNAAIIAEMFDKGYLNGYYFKDIVVTESNGTVTVSNFKMIEDGVVTNIAGGTFANFSGYLSVVNGLLSNSANGRLVCTKLDGEFYIAPNYAYGLTREWLEHYHDVNAHDDVKGKGIYSLINNFPVIEKWQNPVVNPLDTFSRWSHQYNNTDKPARSDELLYWGWNAVTGALYNNQESDTFISLVSAEQDTYAFSTLIEGVSTSNGVVAILLAAKTVGVEQKNLTLTIANSAPDGNSNKITSLVQIWEDYFQPTQKLISTVDERTEDIGDWNQYYGYVSVTRDQDQLSVSIIRDFFPEGDREDVIELLPNIIENVEEWLIARRNFLLSDTVPELTGKLSYGYGGRKVKDVNLHLLPTFREELIQTYAMQSYLKEVATNQTEQVEVTPSNFQVDFTQVGKGLFKGTVNTTDFVALMDEFDKPYTVDYDYGATSVDINVRFLFEDTNGTQLYEPPTSLPTSSVRTISMEFLK